MSNIDAKKCMEINSVVPMFIENTVSSSDIPIFRVNMESYSGAPIFIIKINLYLVFSGCNI